jgi:hypothetical protein
VIDGMRLGHRDTTLPADRRKVRKPNGVSRGDPFARRGREGLPMPRRRTFASGILPILFGTADAGPVDPHLACLGAPSVAQVVNLCLSIAAARGCPCPVAGRSRRASCPTLSACPLRFAILAPLAPIARLTGHGQPLARLTVPSSTGFQPVRPLMREGLEGRMLVSGCTGHGGPCSRPFSSG